MKEFRIRWAARPTAYNPPRILFVEAENEKDAMQLARDHIERAYGVAAGIFGAEEVTESLPPGRVKGAQP
jgi:hypothetical protein